MIELLVVVGIIVILATIAIANMLEAQTRSKVSRVRAELRTVATALEAYAVDCNDFPPNDASWGKVLPIELTTPIAYLTGARFKDPFTEKLLLPGHGDLGQYYTYHRIVNHEEFVSAMHALRPPAPEAVDQPGLNLGALAKYGKWKLLSFGPDQKYQCPVDPAEPVDPTEPVVKGTDRPYDPTNGTTSLGNIARTQASTIGTLAH